MIQARVKVPLVTVESWAEYRGFDPTDSVQVQIALNEQKAYGHKVLAWKRIPNGVAFQVVKDDNRDQVEASWPQSS